MVIFAKLCMDTLMYIYLLFKAIKSGMQTAQNIINNFINEDILPLKVSSSRSGWWYLRITQFSYQ